MPDTMEPGQEITEQTTNLSSSASGPLTHDMANLLRTIEQKRAASQVEREARASEAFADVAPSQERPSTIERYRFKPRPNGEAVTFKKPAPPPPECAECEDRGYVGFSYQHTYCTCERGKKAKEIYEEERERTRKEQEEARVTWHKEQRETLFAGLDKAYQGWDMDNYPGNPDAKRQALQFVETWDTAQNLGMVGPVGSGKTSLMVSVYKLLAPKLLEYWSNGAEKIKFVSVPDLLDSWRNSFDEDKRSRENTFARLFARVAEARLLVLDDLGAERPTEWTQEKFYRLIDERSRKELPTFWTSNCSLDELKDVITPRCYSRLMYRGPIIQVSGDDLRRVFMRKGAR